MFGVLNEDEPDVTLPAAPLKVKKSSIKDTDIQIPSYKMGIQTLREVLEDAKNNQKLSANDSFAYTKLLVEWMAAKGDAEIKKAKLVGVREIYKRVLYKKIITYGIMKFNIEL